MDLTYYHSSALWYHIGKVKESLHTVPDCIRTIHTHSHHYTSSIILDAFCVFIFFSNEWIISSIIILIHWWLITKLRNLPVLHSSWLAVFWHSIFSYYTACFLDRNLWGMKSWLKGLGQKAKHKVRVCDSEMVRGQWKSAQANGQT